MRDKALSNFIMENIKIFFKICNLIVYLFVESISFANENNQK